MRLASWTCVLGLSTLGCVTSDASQATSADDSSRGPLTIIEESTGRELHQAESLRVGYGGIPIGPQGEHGHLRFVGERCEIATDGHSDVRFGIFVAEDCRAVWESRQRVCLRDVELTNVLDVGSRSPRVLVADGCAYVVDIRHHHADTPEVTMQEGRSERPELHLRYDDDAKRVCATVSIADGCPLTYMRVDRLDGKSPAAADFQFDAEGRRWTICYPHDWCSEAPRKVAVADACGRGARAIASRSGKAEVVGCPHDVPSPELPMLLNYESSTSPG